MKVKIYKNFKVNKKHKNSILLIGNFDGLHQGHQKLFKLGKNYRRAGQDQFVTDKQTYGQG